MVKKSRIPTAAEVLAQQKRDHEKVPNVPARTAPKKALATTGDSNAWIEISTALTEHLGAPFAKFTKDGTFAVSDTETIPAGTRCVAHADDASFGWNLWRDGNVVDRRSGLVRDRYVPPQRAELGDLDQIQWEVQPDGSRRDPWQFSATLPISRMDTDEVYNFTTGSKGGLNAINGIVRAYGKRIAKGLEGLPIVE